MNRTAPSFPVAALWVACIRVIPRSQSRPRKRAGAGLAVMAGLCLFMCPAPAWAVSAVELFLALPSGECGGYGPVERQMMLDSAISRPGNFGPASVPDIQHAFVTIISDNYLVLQRPAGQGNISYKVFPGHGFDLLAVCRGRQPNTPADPSYRFDLGLYRHDSTGLTRVEQADYMPSVSILDFVTRDTLMDPAAVRDIAARADAYPQCLTCNASIQDRGALDIITVTTVNAAACHNFLPPFGLLPLNWNGLNFTKPYDRAMPPPGNRY